MKIDPATNNRITTTSQSAPSHGGELELAPPPAERYVALLFISRGRTPLRPRRRHTVGSLRRCRNVRRDRVMERRILGALA